MKTLRVTLVKSPIGYSKKIKDTVASLGLSKLNMTKEHSDVPHIRGMINKVSHLVKVEEISGKKSNV